jgi:hypothetical protein
VSEQRYWQPWQPTVGDYVRIRISPECRMDWGTPGIEKLAHARVIGHPATFTGLIGIVDIDQACYPEWASHPYGVMFDMPIPCTCCQEEALGGWFAAIELEPITTEVTT